ncbi:MAG: cyclic nucleotide-binding domain-containing protein, partial [Nitrospirae bacterium]|nr:cyclic nucleotide-binding domain-containing protein [Nitrospirota bacterium]
VGGSSTLSTLSVGDIFGEMSLLSFKPRTATVTAASEVEVIKISRKTLNKVMFIKPGINNLLKDYYVARLNAMLDSLRDEREKVNNCMCETLQEIVMPSGEDYSIGNSHFLANRIATKGQLDCNISESQKGLSHQASILKRLKSIIIQDKTNEIQMHNIFTPTFLKGIVRASIESFINSVLNNQFLRKNDLLSKISATAEEYLHRLAAGSITNECDALHENFLMLFNEFINENLHKVPTCNYRKDDVIFSDGDASDSIYVIKDGSVSVYPFDLSGNVKQETATLGKTEIFGEIAFFKKTPRTATVRAQEDVSLYELDRALVEQLIKVRPKILEYFNTVYQSRIKNLVKEIEAIKAYYKEELGYI